MTICYWGGVNGAKKNLRWLMSYNNKKFAVLFDHTIQIEHNQVHWDGFVTKKAKINRSPRCWDLSRNIEILYYKEGHDDLKRITMQRRDLDFIYSLKKRKETDRNSSPYSMTKGRTFHLPKVTIEPEMIDESLDGTMIQFEAINKIKIEADRPNVCRVQVKDIPEDVHLVLSHGNRGAGLINPTYTGMNLQDDWNKFRNIVPYKTNLVDRAVNAMDIWTNMSIFNSDPIKHKLSLRAKDRHDQYVSKVKENTQAIDLISMLYPTKEKLYEYLDNMVFNYHHSTIQELKDNGIQFEYFNLDNGDYKKTFGVEKEYGGFRNQTLHYLCQMSKAKNKKQARLLYFEIRQIAKEYIASRGNPKDNRL